MSDQIGAVRKFNRFFTEQIGAFDRKFLNNDSSLPERRVLYEVGTHEPIRAVDISAKLKIDRSNLSRIISNLETKKKWISRESDDKDARIRRVKLTELGRQAHQHQNQQQDEIVRKSFAYLSPFQKKDLIHSLSLARLLMQLVPPGEGEPAAAPLPDQETVRIRPFESGEIPYIASRQAKLYKDTFDWGVGLEINVMETSLNFLKNFKEGQEQCFVAELDGCIVGSAMLTHEDDQTARIRMVYVEPAARKRGIGNELMQSCIGFALDRKYKQIVLWTHTILTTARRMYANFGFICYETHTHTEFGKPLQGEMWKLDLASFRSGEQTHGSHGMTVGPC